jgi:hypothetical protein
MDKVVNLPLFPLNFHLIDCSSIIAFSGADYANPNKFIAYRKKIWEFLEYKINEDKIKTVPQFWKELEYNDTDSYKRLFFHHDKFTVGSDDDMDSMALHLIFKYPSLIDIGLSHYTRDPSDPYLIVFAQKWGVPIIADEKRIQDRLGKRQKKKLKIPDICDKENITCICLEMYLKQQGIIPQDYIP